MGRPEDTTAAREHQARTRSTATEAARLVAEIQARAPRRGQAVKRIRRGMGRAEREARLKILAEQARKIQEDEANGR